MSEHSPDGADFTPNYKPITERIRELKERRRQNAYLFNNDRSLSTELEVLREIKSTEPDPEEIRDAYIDTSLSFLDGISISNAGAHAALDTAVGCLTPYDPETITPEDSDEDEDDEESSGTTIEVK